MKSVYINKQGEEVIVAVLSQGQHQFTGLLKVQTHHRQFSTFHQQLTQLGTLLLLCRMQKLLGELKRGTTWVEELKFSAFLSGKKCT